MWGVLLFPPLLISIVFFLICFGIPVLVFEFQLSRTPLPSPPSLTFSWTSLCLPCREQARLHLDGLGPGRH